MGRIPASEARARRMARNVQQQEIPRKFGSPLHAVRSLARKDQPRFERGHSQSDRTDAPGQARRESSSRINSGREGARLLWRPPAPGGRRPFTVASSRHKKDQGETNMATRAALDRKVVSHTEWLAARTEFLKKEKELTRLRDELSKKRRELPWERVTKTYAFDSFDGVQTFEQLFDGRSQLVIYHAMFDLKTVTPEPP